MAWHRANGDRWMQRKSSACRLCSSERDQPINTTPPHGTPLGGEAGPEVESQAAAVAADKEAWTNRPEALPQASTSFSSRTTCSWP